MNDSCVTFVPFSNYDWTFARRGWLPWNPAAYCFIAAFCAIAYWMSIELLILVYVTFKRHTGLYFWSIIVTTLGIILQTTGYILKCFENDTDRVLVLIICKIGWVSNVTGFSIVLWSRLHLVINNPRLLRNLLIIILLNALFYHTPLIVMEFGLLSSHNTKYYLPMYIMERIQVTVFTLQETFLSCLYIYHTARFLNNGFGMHTRNVIGLLLCVQVLVVALDATLTTIDYVDWFTLKCTFHPFVYSVKLKLEFIVLNQLQALVRRGVTPGLGHDLNLSASDLGQLEKQSPLSAGFDRGFITKAGMEKDSIKSGRSENLVLQSFDKGDGETKVGDRTEKVVSVASSSSQGTLFDEEYDLKNVLGRPDVGLATDGVDNIERQYLGRWGLDAKS